MIREMTKERMPESVKECLEGWLDYFRESIEMMSFNPYTDYHGEDKNLLAWRSKDEFIQWYGQPPGNEPYRDDGFYTRELTWLSMWCQPKKVVECGTDKGIGTFLLSRLNPQAVVYSIDNREKVPMPDGREVEQGFFVDRNAYNHVLIHGDSRGYYQSDVGLCFIDGDHSKEAVWEDSINAWKNRNRHGKWAIIWHDYRDGDDFVGLKKSIKNFSDLVRMPVYKLPDSSTVWMFNEQ